MKRMLLLTIVALIAVSCEPPPHQPIPQSQPPKAAAAMLSDAPQGGTGRNAANPQTGTLHYSSEHYRLVSKKDEIVSILDNGLVVIARRVASPVVAVRGYAFTGGVYEGKWLGGGLSHLLEHLVAGGSNGRRDEEQNKELLQAIGNNSNAETTEDHTVFFVNTTPQHMAQAVDSVTGWMFTAKITPQEYAREYQVVQRELEMGKGEPDRQLFYLMAMNRYLVSPARVPVIGYQPVIQGLSRDDVYNYYRMAYVPNNMMFVVVGDEDPQKMLRAVQHDSDYAPGRAFSHDIASEPPVVSTRTVAATFPKLGEARINLAFPSVELSNRDMYALDLLAAVLGQGESSILTQELRDKRQLVSAVAAEDETPSYVQGSFDIMMELPAEKVSSATSAVLDLVQQAKSKPIEEARLERARQMLRTALIARLQKSESIAEAMGDDYMSTGDPHFSELYLKRIDELKPAELQAVARKYLDPGKLMTTALFPAEYAGAAGLPKVEDLLRNAATTQEVATKEQAGPSQVQRVVLDNGTILLLKRMTTTPLVSVQMYSLGGLTAEDAKTNGLGNLTMQMLMRGTKDHTAQQIAEFFDSIGGAMTTICGNNTWGWNATFLSKDFDKGFQAYADVVNNPTFPEDETSEMKKRADAQIATADADWAHQALHYFRREFFGPMNSPYQFLPIGSKENVDSFTPQQMRDWYEQKVQTTPRVLAVFGDIDMDHVKQLAADLLGKGAARPQPPAPQERAQPAAARLGPASVKVTDVKVQKTEQALAGVWIGFYSNSVLGDPANYTLDVIDTLTSGYTYPTGYIFETLRGMGLVYVADARNAPGRSASLPGTFEAYAGCDPQNVNKVVELILQNIARVEGSPQDINMDWFKRSKELIVVADAMENETPAAQAQLAAVDEVLGLGYDYHKQFADRIRRVTLEQVQETAHQRLAECLVTISTPRPDLVQIKPGVRSYQTFPPVELAPKGVRHDAAGSGK